MTKRRRRPMTAMLPPARLPCSSPRRRRGSGEPFAITGRAGHSRTGEGDSALATRLNSTISLIVPGQSSGTTLKEDRP
jgi:hypothetical protein